jgi:two-component system, NarL family, response regulator
MIDVVIVEDHPAIADGLAALIGSENDIDVVGIAHGLEQADALIRDARPQVVLCDVMLAGRDDGFQLLRRFGAQSRFLMLTAYDYQAHHATAVAAGAAGYLSKLSDAETIVRTIRRVATGEAAIPAPVMESARRAPAVPTARERELLTMLTAGASNDDIAYAMGIRIKTVEGMLRRLYDRYGTANRTQLVRFSMHQGWLTSDPPADPPRADGAR